MATALVIGSEGKGLSRLVRENCDFLVRIPMRGRINSLNAAVAAGILAYHIKNAQK
jgi:23S rRNA (guanosine2251-2'-O)-methyltransferase